ncbi:UNVERIFIED_CONTAM: hypothetical protein HDU68_004896 [Siphonaria sp. JEL0065]|nr:hypothetical protein HDU68_004896 [Siphonaria sp. JEL0065]
MTDTINEQTLYDKVIDYLSTHDLKTAAGKLVWDGVSGAAGYVAKTVEPAVQFVQTTAFENLEIANRNIAPVAQQFAEKSHELVGPFQEAFAPAIEAFAPIHQVLSQKVLGPISWYFAILLIVQLIVNIWWMSNPNKGKVVARHILVKTEKEAKEIQLELRKEKTLEAFVKLAKKHSLDKKSSGKGGLLEPFGKKEHPEEFEKYCFGLKTKEWVVSPIIQTDKGFHLIMVQKKA